MGKGRESMSSPKTKKSGGKGVVLVDGAGGFLGSHVVQRLCRTGWRVRATDLPSSDLKLAAKAGAEVVACNLLDPRGLPDLLRGVRKIVHLAGLFDYSLPPRTLRDANVETTRNLCEAALRSGVDKFVHVSSIAVYGRPGSLPNREDQVRHPNNFYSLTKIRGEELALEYHASSGQPVVTVRPAGIYGPRSRYGQVHLFALMALLRARGLSRIPLFTGGPVMHHVHVEDVAEAIRFLLEAPTRAGEAYNIADDTPLAQGDFLRFVAAQMGLRPLFSFPSPPRLFWPFIRALLFLPDSFFETFNASLASQWKKVIESQGLRPAISPRIDQDFLGYMKGNFILDTTKIKSLGFELKHPSTLEGMTHTLAWYRREGWLPA
jgi:nucleoside-diphosphate-sugar epimerase